MGGTLVDPPVQMSGRLHYQYETRLGTAENRTVNFDIIRHRPKVGGGPSPVTGEYDAVLRITDKNYKVLLPVVHTIKPGETERIRLRLAAQQSSLHTFTANLNFSDKTSKRLGH